MSFPGSASSSTEDNLGGHLFSTPLVIKAQPLNLPSTPVVPSLIGSGRCFGEFMQEVGKVAQWPLSVVLTGQTGTGKTTIAQAIHDLSPRAKKSFVSLNCVNISPELVESELFGHEKGAFSGAVSRKIGLMELADGGTLFLDEIGEMPLSMQAKLLTALESKRFRRVGSEKEIYCDVRIISATNRDLAQLVKDGQFRQDLRARLGSIWLSVPTLAERRDDIPALLSHYLMYFASQFNRATTYTVESGALAILINCGWPDNIRQLRNVAERLAFDVMDSGLITAGDAQRVAQMLGALPSHTTDALAPLAPQEQPYAIALPSYIVGEPYEKFTARVLLALRDELQERYGDHNSVASILRINSRSLYKRIQRAKSLV